MGYSHEVRESWHGALVFAVSSFYSGGCKDLDSWCGGSGSVFRQVCIELRCTVRRESQNLRDARWTPSDRFAGMCFVWILPSTNVLLGPMVRRIVADCSLVVVQPPPPHKRSVAQLDR